MILIPDEPVDLDAICERLRGGVVSGKHHRIIVVAEGAVAGFDVAQVIHSPTGHATCTSWLGDVHRGGSPTAVDRDPAGRPRDRSPTRRRD